MCTVQMSISGRTDSWHGRSMGARSLVGHRPQDDAEHDVRRGRWQSSVYSHGYEVAQPTANRILSTCPVLRLHRGAISRAPMWRRDFENTIALTNPMRPTMLPSRGECISARRTLRIWDSQPDANDVIISLSKALFRHHLLTAKHAENGYWMNS